MNPLDQLADISAPNAVAIWPLAWGYWVAIAIAITVLTIVTVSLLKYYRLNQQKKSALAYIQALACSDSDYATKIQITLKQLCGHYFEHERATTMHGNQWLGFVKDKYKGTKLAELENALHLIQTGIYAPTSTQSDSDTQTKNETIKAGIVDWITKSLPIKPVPKQNQKQNPVRSQEATIKAINGRQQTEATDV
jgi:hypothetical protein